MFALAFLNVGGEEILLVALLALAFFGVDKLPQAARALGRWRAKMQQQIDAVAREIETPEEREFRKQTEFERRRESQVRSPPREDDSHPVRKDS